jgi:hypothetical protein
VVPNAPVEESTVAEPTELPPKKISTEPVSTGQVPVADTPSPTRPLVGSRTRVGSTGGTTTSNHASPPQFVVT